MVTLPVDSIKTLYQNNLIAGMNMFTSLRCRFLTSYSGLSGEQKKEFHRHLDARSVPDAGEWQVLDALIDYSMYKYPIAELNILNDPSDAREYEYRKGLLSLRGRAGS